MQGDDQLCFQISKIAFASTEEAELEGAGEKDDEQVGKKNNIITFHEAEIKQ